MQQQAVAQPTAQQKLIHVNQQMGNTGIKKQQGTSRVMYDSLPLDGADNVLSFFAGSNTRNFPRTNTGSFGNKLEVAESTVIQRVYFSVMTVDAVDPLEVTGNLDLTTAGLPGLYASELSIFVAEKRVMKPIPLTSFQPEFNKNAYNSTSQVFWADTDLTIPPLLDYEFRLKVPNYTPVANAFLRCTYEGVGSIISPTNPF